MNAQNQAQETFLNTTDEPEAPTQQVDDLKPLLDKAAAVLASAQRPVFVEFSGSPKSGKSTCIDIVAHFFRRAGFKVLAPTEGASKRTPYYLRSNLVAFNTWSASYALTHVLEGLYHSDKYHLAILDRGLFDALAWFEYLKMKGQISDTDCQKVQEFIRIDQWRSVIDAVFLFTADPDTSMQREIADKLTPEHGHIMNPETLGELKQALENAREAFAGEFKHFFYVDTSANEATNPKSTASGIADKILDLFTAAKSGG